MMMTNIYAAPFASHILDARTALVLLAAPLGETPEGIQRLYQRAEVALRRTYGELDRADVSRGELRRAAICGDLRRMTMGQMLDAANRLD